MAAAKAVRFETADGLVWTGKPPRYCCHLGCILLKTAAIIVVLRAGDGYITTERRRADGGHADRLYVGVRGLRRMRLAA